jgi:Skp family chaperone for outer membrane proteins
LGDDLLKKLPVNGRSLIFLVTPMLRGASCLQMKIRFLGAVLLSTVVLSSCREKSSARIENEIRAIEQKTTRLQEEVEVTRSYIKAASEAELAYSDALHSQQRIQIQIRTLVEEKNSIQEEYNRMRGDLLAREADRIRRQRVACVGKDIGELITLRGRHFEGVIVTKASERGLDIIHANGATRLLPEELSIDQRRQLGVMALPKDGLTLADSIHNQ